MTNPVEISEDEGRKLFDLFKSFDEEDREVREQLIRRWKKLEYYWKGYQYLAWSEMSTDWQTPDLDPGVFDDYLDNIFYTKVFNVYRAHGESIIAALSTAVPGVVFTPDDANNADDIETAKAYTKIASLIQNHNRAKLLLTHAIYHLYNQGVVFGHTYGEESYKYGEIEVPKYEQVTQGTCPECGNPMPPEVGNCPSCGAMTTPKVETFPQLVGVEKEPKSRQIIRIYGPLHVHVPVWCKRQEDVPFLCLREDWHYTKAKLTFPEIESQIEPEEDPEEYEKWARKAVEDRHERRGLVTIKKVWFRPYSFEAIKDDEIRESIEKKFPGGCCAIFVNDIFARAVDEKLDDHWTISFDPRTSTIHADPVGSPLAPIQEVTNEMFNLTLQTVEHAIPETFADPEVLDFDRYRKSQSRPGQIYPAKARPGQNIGESFATVKTATVSSEIEKFFGKLEQMAQFVVGSFPSIYGGQMVGSRTAAEYQMSRQQALQRLSTSWTVITQFWCDMMARSCVQFARDMKSDEPMTVQQGGSFITDWIRKSQLTGRVGSVDPDYSEQFPSSWAEKRDAVMNLLQLQIPEVNQALFHPENLSLIKNTAGLTELYIPGDADRNKQLREIKMLVNSQPTQNPMTGTMEPSVPIDPIADDHAVQIQVCKNFLISEQGEFAKATNPPGYQNVVAHMQQHEFAMQQQTFQQFEGTPPNEPPQSAATQTGA